jgi:hypothetical protein
LTAGNLKAPVFVPKGVYFDSTVGIKTKITFILPLSEIYNNNKMRRRQ